MTYLGCDPGKAGAYAIIRPSEGLVQVDDFLHWLSTLTDFEAFRDAAKLDGSKMLCALEKVSAFPGQGVTSMFTFGESFGRWQMLLECLGIPYVLVSPARWQKAVLGSKPPKGQAKARVWETMRRRFPRVELSGPRGAKLTGRSDALALAYYAMTEEARSQG